VYPTASLVVTASKQSATPNFESMLSASTVSMSLTTPR